LDFIPSILARAKRLDVRPIPNDKTRFLFRQIVVDSKNSFSVKVLGILFLGVLGFLVVKDFVQDRVLSKVNVTQFLVKSMGYECLARG